MWPTGWGRRANWLPQASQDGWGMGLRVCGGVQDTGKRRTWHLYQRKESTFDYLRRGDGVSCKPEEVYLIMGRVSEESREIRGKKWNGPMTRCPKAQGSW